MGIRLKQIYLNNWKCYRQQTIKFDLNTDKQIWLIFGLNGYGKTSILEAIQWCLYGHKGVLPLDFMEYFYRVSSKKKPTSELSVRLNFEDDGKNYYITRTAKCVLRGKTYSTEISEPTFNQDGRDKSNAREYIEGLLPKSCKDFFFFDGAKIQQYAQLTQTNETREAIERILGIPELKNLREDAEKALKSIEKVLSSVSSANSVMQQKTSYLREIEEEIELIEQQLESAKREHLSAIKIYEDCQERARQIKELRDKIEQLKRRQLEEERLRDKLENAEKAVINSLRQSPIPLMLEFVQEVYDELQRDSIKTNRISVSISQLQELLKAEICVCGRCMDAESRYYIQEQLEQFSHLDILTQEAIAKNTLLTQLNGLLRYQPPDFDRLQIERDRLQNDFDDLSQEISRLKLDTQGVNEAETDEIWRKVGATENEVKSKKERIDRLSRQIEQKKQEIDHLRREIETLASQDQETATLAKQVKLARGLRDAANELIEWYISDRQQTIEATTSEIHRQITNKPDEYCGVTITPQYTLGVQTLGGEVLNPETLSAGEKEALAFSFITGLNLASETAAPLVMDTPFGHLDNPHQRNLVKCLPNLPSQVILLASDRDFPDDLLRELRPHVAEILHIRREATEDISVVEVEKD